MLVVQVCDKITTWLFGVIGVIMQSAPIGAFGAMAFTIGKYGLKTLLPLGKLMACVYITSILFVFIVLGLIAAFHGFSIWKFISYIKEELLIVLGTSSSESVLPRHHGEAGRAGLLQIGGRPGDSLGLFVQPRRHVDLSDHRRIFVAQATNTHLTAKDEFTLLLVLMLTSKGAAAVTGGGFITLAATLSALGTVPVAGITLLLGVDRFMSEMRR